MVWIRIGTERLDVSERTRAMRSVVPSGRPRSNREVQPAPGQDRPERTVDLQHFWLDGR